MWNSYFHSIQNKYSMRLSTKNPLVIRFDGKNITKNKDINLLYDNDGSFSKCLNDTAWYFSKKYNGYALFGTDEISFIFEEPILVYKDLEPESNNNHSNEIIALFSQHFFDYFNNLYKKGKVFWHGKCFSISSEKFNSYIKFRSSSIENVVTTYFLKRNNISMGNTPIEKRLLECEKFGEFESIKNISKGTLYFNGTKIDLNEFLNGNFVVIEDKSKIDDIGDLDIDIEFIGL